MKRKNLKHDEPQWAKCEATENDHEKQGKMKKMKKTKVSGVVQ